MGDFRPNTESHAIAEAAIAIFFKTRLPPELIHSLSGKLQLVKQAFPETRAQFGIQLNFDPFTGVTVENSAIGAIALQDRKESTGRTLNVLPTHVAVSFLQYDGWSTVWPAARSYLQEIVELLQADAAETNFPLGFQNVSVQYVDRFHAALPLDEGAFSRVLSRDSRYLPSHVFDGAAFWHCHAGWLDTSDTAEEGSTRLTVLNITASPSQPVPSIVGGNPFPSASPDVVLTIDNLLRVDLLAAPSDIFAGGERSVIDRVVESLHDRNKAIVRDLLTADTSQTIGLGISS